MIGEEGLPFIPGNILQSGGKHLYGVAGVLHSAGKGLPQQRRDNVRTSGSSTDVVTALVRSY
jgi:hypothetical protein